MPEMDPNRILEGAKRWFKEIIVRNHVSNIEKCANPDNLKINPFTVGYLAKVLEGDVSAESLARAIILPRVLGTSISTSFGANMQRFITTALESFGSTTQGIDIEYIDKIDLRKKYCQLKAGPDTINYDDVETIHNHFNYIRNIARVNNLPINTNDLVIGILYGEHSQINGNYKMLEDQHSYNIYTGKDFWHRLTGDINFYEKLMRAISDTANECETGTALNDSIQSLSRSEEIQKILRSIRGS